MKNTRVMHRVSFLAVAGLCLMLGLLAGLHRLGAVPPGVVPPGVVPPGVGATLAADHGPLMVFGFVGGAIGLERTVAARNRWAWAGPVCHVSGVLTLLAGAPRVVPAGCFAASFLVLGGIYALIYHRQPQTAVLVQAAGVIGGVGAAWLWAMTGGFSAAMPLAVLYAVATIIGERMELARVSFAGLSQELPMTTSVMCLVAATVIYIVAPGGGFMLMGACLVGVALIAVRADAAKNLIRSTGLPRYSAACMLAGYGWLTVAGFLWLGFRTGDSAIHAIFLGFVMSMIFAHAPTILAGVVRARMPFSPLLYLPVALLHLGLLVRVSTGSGVLPGGIANVVAVVLFVLCGVGLVIRAAR